VTIRERRVILVVDDEEKIRIMICEQLEEAGYHVSSAENADIAIKMVSTLSHIDLLVTDVRMPGTIDGFDLIQLAVARLPHLRTLAISGFTGESAHRLHLADRFLAKPFTMGKLEREVETLLAA